MHRLQSLINKNSQTYAKILRYGVVSLLTYAYALTGIYLLTKFSIVDPKLSYAIIYSTIYIVQYPFLIKFVYKVDYQRKFILRYGLFLILNWLVSSLLYYFFVKMTAGVWGSFLMVTLVMFPIRYFIGVRIYK